MRRLIEQTRFTRPLIEPTLGERAETAFSRASNLISINMQILPSRAPQRTHASYIHTKAGAHYVFGSRSTPMLSISAPIKLSKCFVTALALLCKITAADCYLRRHLEKCERTVLNKCGQFTPCMMRRAHSSRLEGHNGAAFPLADRVTAKDARAPLPHKGMVGTYFIFQSSAFS